MPARLLAAEDDPMPARATPSEAVPRVESLAAFGLRVSPVITQSRRYGSKVAVLWIDTEVLASEDHAWPPQAREQLTQALSSRLRNRVRATDLVLQFGDHAFAVLLLSAGADEAATVEQRLQQLLNGPYGVDGGLMYVGLHMGYASFPEEGRDGAELAAKARSAAQRAP